MTFIHRASNSHRRRLTGDYAQKVLGLGPIAYWPLDEASGAVARCLVDSAQNGAYTGVTLANDAAGPFGTSAPFFDGVNDYCTITTAALIASFNTSVGSASIWTKVNDVGVWTDAAQRNAWSVRRDNDNQMWHSKRSAANNIQTYHEGNNVGTLIANAGHSEVVWTNWSMTWNAGGNLVTYVNGVQDGAAAAGVTAWALALSTAFIGSQTAAPSNPWHGWLAHCAFWNRVLSQGALTDLANP